jgi:uncharacterized protein
MPHKCSRCHAIYDDGSPEILEGCGCGSRVFLYLRPDYAGTPEETIRVLEARDVGRAGLDWLDAEFKNEFCEKRKTLSLDIENVLQRDEGKYELNIKSLMKGEPIVIKASEGVYYIDIKHGMRKKTK